MQFAVEDKNDYLKITVPRFRHDVEIPEDITEEIARIFGYDNIPTIPYNVELTIIYIYIVSKISYYMCSYNLFS